MKIRLLSETAKAPKRATPGASCWDVYADEPKVLMPGERAMIRLGFSIELPIGMEAQIRPRSGLTLNAGVLCHLGTIDSDYRGEVGAILFNLGDTVCEIKVGDRIAQMAVCMVFNQPFELVASLSETERGTGGFGSTGK